MAIEKSYRAFTLKFFSKYAGSSANRIGSGPFDENIGAACAAVRMIPLALCCSHQLNVTKGGYDVGIHAAQAEFEKCKKNGNCALKVDFKNTFNSIKRNFFL